jgi:hypothetical protein
MKRAEVYVEHTLQHIPDNGAVVYESEMVHPRSRSRLRCGGNFSDSGVMRDILTAEQQAAFVMPNLHVLPTA